MINELSGSFVLVHGTLWSVYYLCDGLQYVVVSCLMLSWLFYGSLFANEHINQPKCALDVKTL